MLVLSILCDDEEEEDAAPLLFRTVLRCNNDMAVFDPGILGPVLIKVGSNGTVCVDANAKASDIMMVAVNNPTHEQKSIFIAGCENKKL